MAMADYASAMLGLSAMTPSADENAEDIRKKKKKKKDATPIDRPVRPFQSASNDLLNGAGNQY